MLRLIRRLLLGILAIAVLVIGGTYAVRTIMTPAPLCDGCNVILISLDAVNAASVSEGLPLLAARADTEGTVFAHAYASATRQLQGHAAVQTGAYPWDIGLMRETNSLPKDTPLISEILASYGYTTAGFVEGSFIDSLWGFSRGFTEWNHPAPRKAHGLEAFFSKTDEWIRAHRASETPYFLYLNPYDIYSFFDADGTRDGFTYADVRAASAGDASARTRMREGYMRKLATLDSYLDAIIKAAQEDGNGRKTVVVVTASYSEYLTRAPQEEIGSLRLPKSSALHVPLLFFIPGVDAKRILPTVESRNVAATILELVGAKPSAVSGTSLASYIRTGEGENQLVRSYVANTADEKLIEPPDVFYTYMERAHMNGVQEQASTGPPDTDGFMLSLVYDEWHLVQDEAGTTYLFNTVRDPEEKTNLTGSAYTLTPSEQQDQQDIGVLMGALVQKK